MRPEAWCWLAAGLLACGRNDARTAAPAQPPALPASASAASSLAPPTAQPPALSSDSGPAFGAGIVDVKGERRGVALLTDVRAARHDGFDRVVFEFAAETPPGYHVEYIDRPVRKCGSGEPTPIAGDGWLEIRFEPADAHTPSGAPTIAQREQVLALGVLKELEQTCDFEAQVAWVMGVSRPNRYRVLTLRQPTRVVVDVRH
ncbi:MAG TPA: hypothetical protein VIW29_13570 [Polyangiaceae bacterium]